MAKTVDTIEMDFRNAKRQADELEQIAQNLKTLSEGRAQTCLFEVAASWKGENASAFCKKGAAACSHIQNSANDLKNAADALRRIAANLYEAEMKNYKTARNRE